MHENRFNEYRIPSGMLIVFLEKALTLIHMETHLDDVSRWQPIRCVQTVRVRLVEWNGRPHGHYCLTRSIGQRPFS